MAFNIYEAVTQRIIEQLEQGIIPWRKTWKGSVPINYVSRKPYQGMNYVMLPYGGEWLTFKQAKDAGGSVKRGEKSRMIVFYKIIEKINDNGEKENIPYLQYSNVFHISQCEGIKSKLEECKPNDNIKPIDTAEQVLNDYINRSGVTFENVAGSNKAFYSPTNDKITMPEITQFEKAEEYYTTAFHESAHSTGHKTRLDRLTETAAFGSAVYSREELTAEIAATMVMNFTGLELPETFENSAAYIQGWLKALKNDDKAIVTAASKAQKAADMILNIKAASAETSAA
jgi:antirestriction protein ArdC